MHRHVLGVTVPPVAICRYGCAGCCALPITIFWVGGVAALIYFFFYAQPEHSWLYNGSLLLGVGMILLSIVWTEMTITRVMRDGCDKPAKPGKRFCGGVGSTSQELDETDPLDEVRRAREL